MPSKPNGLTHPSEGLSSPRAGEATLVPALPIKREWKIVELRQGL